MPLYRYLPPERSDVVSGARIRFTQPNSLNDPFELKPFFKMALNPETLIQSIRERMDLATVLREKYQTMPTEIRCRMTAEQFVQFGLTEAERRKVEFDAIFEEEMASFLEVQPILGEAFRHLIHQYFGHEIGILSLSECVASDLMWAHYAKDHSGFVIEFDETNSFFNQKRSEKDEFFHLRKVSYLKNSLRANSMEELVDSDLFASKLSKWAYEREWRMLVPLTGRQPELHNGDEPVHLIQIPKEIIAGVIFGVKASADLRRKFFSIKKNDPAYSHVQFREAFVDLEKGRISTRPISSAD
jgi:hypothetical protein